MIKSKWIILCMLAMIIMIGAGTIFQQSRPQNEDPGIGPVKNVALGAIDHKMVTDGKKLFTAKCLLCHDLDTKKTGPPLRNITKERKPEYIMNLLVNSVEMQKQDPYVKDLLKKYNNVIMPDPAINQAQARTILEYLRSVAK
ncbi:MAG: cytochrome c [Bacteroidota bacterium]|nr:cytochrome c [Bacteroidota bacterium]